MWSAERVPNRRGAPSNGHALGSPWSYAELPDSPAFSPGDHVPQARTVPPIRSVLAPCCTTSRRHGRRAEAHVFGQRGVVSPGLQRSWPWWHRTYPGIDAIKSKLPPGIVNDSGCWGLPRFRSATRLTAAGGCFAPLVSAGERQYVRRILRRWSRPLTSRRRFGRTRCST